MQDLSRKARSPPVDDVRRQHRVRAAQVLQKAVQVCQIGKPRLGPFCDGTDRCRRDGRRVHGPDGAPVGDGTARDQVRSDRHRQLVPVPDRHGDHRRDQVRQPGPVYQSQLQSQLLRQYHHDRVGEEDCDLIEAANRRQRGDHVRLQVPALGREDSSFIEFAFLVKYSYFSVRLQI
uniref:(northern house mosquito) hypothetical protein n=1 Tax=Culex pipiens TaxID=7175 RepID=A0A8D8HZ35_CULPI